MRASRHLVSVTVLTGCVLISSLVLYAVSPAPATTPGTPPPGTPSQVQALVAASTQIKRANAAVLKEVSTAGKDTWAVEFKIAPDTSCLRATQCDYGDKSGPKTIVLYGDSHARQWLPALNTIAANADARLVLLGQDGCPVVSLDLSRYAQYPSTCAKTRTTSLRVIKSLHPALVILADSTEFVGISRASWEHGLEATIKTISTTGAKVVVLQDDTEFSQAPPACISRFPTQIQHECSVDNPNPMVPIITSAERAAAKAVGVPYILTQQWLCPVGHCSPVVGNFLTHFDRGHLTASYATYLTTVLDDALLPYLPS
jgi:hypothetical protein